MKKAAIALFVAGILFLGLTGSAFARDTEPNLFAIYTTGANGDETSKTTFGWNDTPWLCMDVSNENAHLETIWRSPGNPADFDLNGMVDIDDYAILKENYGQTGTSFTQGDANNDGEVDNDDLGILDANFGETRPESMFYFQVDELFNVGKAWIPLHTGLVNGSDISFAWNDVPDKLGYWSVSATAHGVAGFTVTPEPVSSVLFLIGGTSLIVARLRRKRNYSLEIQK